MRSPPPGYAVCELSIAAATDVMSEPAFMEHILDELLTGQRQPSVRFTEEELAAIEEEHIGEDFLHHPFLY